MVPQILAAGEQELGDNQKSITAGICLTFTLSPSLRRLRWLCAWICMLINLEEEQILFQFSNSWSECGFCDISSALAFKPLREDSKTARNDRRAQHSYSDCCWHFEATSVGANLVPRFPCLLGGPPWYHHPPDTQPPASWHSVANKSQNGPPSFWVIERRGLQKALGATPSARHANKTGSVERSWEGM